MPSHMKCCFNKCTNSSRNTLNLSFHKFPTNEDICKQWVDVCSNDKITQMFNRHGTSQLCKSFRICSEHFKRSDFLHWSLKKKVLCKGSIPTGLTITSKTTLVTNTIEPSSGTITEENESDEPQNVDPISCFWGLTATTNPIADLSDSDTLSPGTFLVTDLMAIDYTVSNSIMYPSM